MDPVVEGEIDLLRIPYHESLEKVTPADVYFDRQYAVLTERDKIKRLTMERRKREHPCSSK